MMDVEMEKERQVTSGGEASTLSVDISLEYLYTGLIKKPVSTTDIVDLGNTCPICKSQTSNFITLENRDGLGIVTKSMCPDCDYVAYNRMPGQAWFDDYYRSVWQQGTGKIDSPCRDLVQVLLPRLKSKEARILDIGTGFGSALMRMQEHGFQNVSGVEASSRSSRIGRERGLNISQGTVETITEIPEIMAGAPYDVIIMRQVLEHFFDVNAAVQNVRKLLKDGGLFFVAVPDFLSEHTLRVSHWFPHIRNFSLRNLSTLLVKHGFELMYQDDGVHVIGIKRDMPTGPLSVTPRAVDDATFSGQVKQKVLRELGLLPHLPAAAGRHIVSCGGFAEDKDLTTQDFQSLPASRRLQYLIKKSLIGSGYNSRSLLRNSPQGPGILSPRNTAVRLLPHLISFDNFEYGGTLELSEFPSDAEALPCLLTFRYPEHEVKGWMR
jgi:SAM-dependent methyltransferase